MQSPGNIHFKILEDIARDLSGDINFPTCMDAAMLIRNTLNSPLVNLQRVVKVVGVEPLISTKLLRLANSAAYNPSGKQFSDLTSAIQRLGLNSVRSVSLAVAMEQMLKSRNLAPYADISRQAWEHSLQVAAIARVLARRLGNVNPDEAMLAGLVHDIGIFYLLYRAAEYQEYKDNHGAIMDLLIGWHEGVGESLIYALGLPEHIAQAIHDHDNAHNLETPCTLRDVLYFANLLAGRDNEWLAAAGTAPAEIAAQEEARARYQDLLAEAAEDIRELRAALGGSGN